MGSRREVRRQAGDASRIDFEIKVATISTLDIVEYADERVRTIDRVDPNDP